MKFFQLIESKLQKLTLGDISIFKICLISFTLMVMKIWPFILSLDWFYYGAIFFISYFYLLYRLFHK